MIFSTIFNLNFKRDFLSDDNYYSLINVSDNIFIGYDNSSNISVVITSNNCSNNSYKLNSSKIIFEFNQEVVFKINDSLSKAKANIIKAKLSSNIEKEIFLNICEVILNSSKENSEESLLESYTNLMNFFKDKKKLTHRELQGLYAELFFIKFMNDKINIGEFWQSKDKLKFDFSLENNIKIDVKSTIGEDRKHHFKHDQLYLTKHKIYIVSYLLRFDDEGLSLNELIKWFLETQYLDYEKLYRLENIILNTESNLMESIKYNYEYSKNNMKIFSGENIPKFNGETPEGVSNAEYDCSLDNVASIDFDDFCKDISENNYV